jgi:hypothetical protein
VLRAKTRPNLRLSHCTFVYLLCQSIPYLKMASQPASQPPGGDSSRDSGQDLEPCAIRPKYYPTAIGQPAAAITHVYVDMTFVRLDVYVGCSTTKMEMNRALARVRQNRANPMCRGTPGMQRLLEPRPCHVPQGPEQVGSDGGTARFTTVDRLCPAHALSGVCA